MMDHPSTERLYEFLDGGLRGAEHRAVAGHLERCARCRGELELARGIERSAGGMLATPSPGFTDAVMERILADAPRPPLAAVDAPSSARSGARRFIVPGTLAAIYLTVMLAIGLGAYGDDGGGGSGWISDVVAPLVGAMRSLGGMVAKVTSGGSAGIVFIAVVALAGLLTVDGFVGGRQPRGRH